MPIEAVIFDMDGVLIESEDYWLEARTEFAHARNLEWTEADHALCMGVNTVEWAATVKERLNLTDMTIEQIIEDIIGRIIALYEKHLPVLPNAVEAVKLAGEHYRVALASGSPTPAIQKVTALMGVDTLFETMVFGDDMERGKPAPDIYLETAKRMNLDPAVCVGIEDSANGIRSLKNAGMYAIAAPSPNFPLSDDVIALADRHIKSLNEFTVELVNGLGA
jgi:beta-phosphoglucomutase-like phosphatase (HAD superfamily)